MNADGTHMRKLTGKTDGFSPAFSPDGKKIFYVSNDGVQTTQRLTMKTKVHDEAPDWQPLL